VQVWQTSNLRRLRLGEGEKERKKKTEENTGQKYNGLPYSIVTRLFAYEASGSQAAFACTHLQKQMHRFAVFGTHHCSVVLLLSAA